MVERAENNERRYRTYPRSGRERLSCLISVRAGRQRKFFRFRLSFGSKNLSLPSRACEYRQILLLSPDLCQFKTFKNFTTPGRISRACVPTDTPPPPRSFFRPATGTTFSTLKRPESASMRHGC